MSSSSGLQLALDLLGVFVFGLSGGLVAVRARLDLFGVLVLAVTAALGGGIVRDVLLGLTPPLALQDWRLLAAAGAAGVTTFLLHPGIARISRVVTVLDAAGLALFCVNGSLRALDVGLGPVGAALIGMTTAIGGGVLRDVLVREVPAVFREELYAVPALAGATLVVVADELGVRDPLVSVGAVSLAFAFRLAAVTGGWTAPTPRDPTR